MFNPPGAARLSVEIAADLRRRIRAGEWDHGLPSERSLAYDYGTSRVTLRGALDILDAEGLLIRRRGRNHQVRRAPKRTLVDVDLPGPGEITVDVATDEERARLNLPVGASVIHIWDLGRLDPEGNPTLWDTLPITTRLRIPGPEGPKSA